MLTLDVMYLNDVENVFHQHLIIIKAAYFMLHKVGRVSVKVFVDAQVLDVQCFF
jgi:hypothetical protein